jgi:hypothetical protein
MSAGELVIIPATREHAEELAPTLRAEDVAEVQACGYVDGRHALLMALERSSAAWAALLDGKVGALFGVSVGPGIEDDLIWLLAGAVFAKHPRPFMRRAKKILEQLLDYHPSLGNFIDARHAESLRWVKWLGFTVGEAVPYGPAGLLFHPARIERV